MPSAKPSVARPGAAHAALVLAPPQEQRRQLLLAAVAGGARGAARVAAEPGRGGAQPGRRAAPRQPAPAGCPARRRPVRA
jgi:hypothetical protein